ncbi:MAG: FGGY family carbohydrate kinase [Eubacteriales bacterium]|nr:FGGY family carbohydrate kinase [Eubacteriales bacterium]
MKNFLLGVDLGTTNVKASIYDFEGKLVSAGEAGSYEIISERPNWAEQDARIWWSDTVLAIRRALAGLKGSADEIAGISVSSQGMAMLPLDANGEPLCLAHIWMDRRGTEEAKYIEEVFGADRIRACFGVKSDSYYQITNILWFKRNRPDLWKRTRHIVKANTYINYKLTGQIALDEPQAIMTMCYDLQKRAWCTELGQMLGIDFERCLPRVGACEEIIGCVTSEAAQSTGLCEGTPVAMGGVDTGLALLEMGINGIGDAGEITGTSSNNVFAARALPPCGCGISFFPPVRATADVPILLYGPTNATGENVRWFRRICGLEGEALEDGTPVYQYLEGLAREASAGCGGLYYYPYLMGERAPLWNNDVRGMLIGATTNTRRGDLLRAIYEGTCFAQREIFEAAHRIGGIQTKRLFVSGGCARSDIWMQIKASMLNLPVYVTSGSGGAPKGDAILAGYATGVYRDLFETAEAMRTIARTFEPVPEWRQLYDEMYPIYIRMRNHLMDDFAESARIFSGKPR